MIGSQPLSKGEGKVFFAMAQAEKQAAVQAMNEKLMEAAEGGDTGAMSLLLRKSEEDGLIAEPFYQQNCDGKSVLMASAASGVAEAVELLIAKGAPWNAIDRSGKCAGEYAIAREDAAGQAIVDILVNAGVRAEMVLGAMARTKASKDRACNALYLERNVRYDKDRILDDQNDAVMMVSYRWQGLQPPHAPSSHAPL